MKKLLFIFILLIILAAAVLVFGMIKVNPGTVKVVYSNISGIIKTPLTDGKLNWVWQRLIPGDTQIYTYQTGKQIIDHSIKISLPFSDIPTLKSKSDFISKINISLQLNIKNENTIILAETGITNFEMLEKTLIKKLENYITDSIVTSAEKSLQQNVKNFTEKLQKTKHTEKMISITKKTLQEYNIELLELKYYFKKLPDFKKYKLFKTAFEKSGPLLIEQIKQYYKHKNLLSKKNILTKHKLDELESIAKLINRYPKLLEYITINKLSDKIKLGILNTDNKSTFILEHYRKLISNIIKHIPNPTKKEKTTLKIDKKLNTTN